MKAETHAKVVAELKRGIALIEEEIAGYAYSETSMMATLRGAIGDLQRANAALDYMLTDVKVEEGDEPRQFEELAERWVSNGEAPEPAKESYTFPEYLPGPNDACYLDIHIDRYVENGEIQMALDAAYLKNFSLEDLLRNSDLEKGVTIRARLQDGSKRRCIVTVKP